MNITRVTQGMLSDRSLSNLQSGLKRLADIQEHLSTGRILNRPSDNPADTGSAMRLRSSLRTEQQHARNAEDGMGWLRTIDTTLQGAGDSVRRARELALQGINGANGPAAREALATEIDQIRAGLMSTANATHLGRPVFGGTTADDVAFTETAGVVTFTGDSNPVNRTVATGVTVNVAQDGATTFGPDGDNVFDHLAALSAALRTPGDSAGIEAGIAALATDENRIVIARADVGSRTVRVEQSVTRAGDAEMTLTNALAEIENADLPRTVVDLKMQEVAYQASLAATSRVLQPSLVDFLR